MNITQVTKLASYELIQPEIANRKDLILWLLDKPKSVDDLVIECIKLGLIKFPNRNYVAPRLTELKDEGKVKISGIKKSPVTGRPVAIFERSD